jgi:3-hydroxyacyl-[acyl-carrier-protein] dehydratase
VDLRGRTRSNLAMAKAPWIDLSTLDMEQEALPLDSVRKQLPQRHEFALLDRVILLEKGGELAVGYKDLSPEDWWAKGHFPGNPVFPGVLMCEGGAHIATLLWKTLDLLPEDSLIGFGGLEQVRFRKQVVPPGRLFFIAQKGICRSRMAKLPVQAVFNGEVVFEATIIGVAL